MEGVLRKMFLGEAVSVGRLSGRGRGGACLYNGTVIDRCRSLSTCGTYGKLLVTLKFG